MADENTVETEQKPEAKESVPKPIEPAPKSSKPEPAPAPVQPKQEPPQEPVVEPKADTPTEKVKPSLESAKPEPVTARPKTESVPQSAEKPPEPPKGLVPKKIIGIPPDKLKLFDKYDMSEIVVTDAGLAKYINLDPVMVPHTGARHANRPFAKSKMNIVERLVNNMMRNENYTGKKTKTYSAVMDAFSIIESKTKKNPVQIFIDALENTTPREEVTRLKYGGVSVPKAVDISSSRRLDIALRNICKGAINTSYKNTKPIEICLANEIMLAAKSDMNSFAISKKEELERVAASAR